MRLDVTENPVIATTHGKVRGKLRNGVYGDYYYCFDAIPYAQPPLGELRFKAPQPLAPWNGVRDCIELANKSLQYNRYTKQIEGSEDCLYLNVYVTKLESNTPLPVMVYLHGGGFNTGDATRCSWGPDYFMRQDVVFITIGYRLGALGFVNFADSTLNVPGNAGLKDIVMALKWINANCHNFNGDPSNITLFGHSSGGSATNLLLLSDASKGLFHKAILMSGYCLGLSFTPNMEHRLAKHLGYEGPKKDKTIYEYLLSLDAHSLVGFNFWTQAEIYEGNGYAFMPSVEAYETPDAILLKKPIELMKSAWGNQVPIMLGVTSFEGLILYRHYTGDPNLFEIYKKHPEYWISSELRQQCDLGMQRKLGKRLVELHFGDKELCEKNVYNALDLRSYIFAYHPTHRVLHSRLANTFAPTYLYRFDFDSPTFNLYRIKHCGTKIRGVSHVDELSYLFYMPGSFRLERDSEEFRMINHMIEMWTAFASKTDPNVETIKPVVWQPVQRFGPRKCLNISNEFTFIEFPETEKCNAWDRIYDEANVTLF